MSRLTKNRVLTFREKLKLHEFMKGIITVDAPGVCHYEGQWTDDKVAAHFGCSSGNVLGLRTSMFGKLRQEGRPVVLDAAAAGMTARIAKLEQHNEWLEASIAALYRKLGEPYYASAADAAEGVQNG
jgi:AraC-like DNA-binding protein